MKKKLIICSIAIVICLLALYAVSIFDYDGVYLGMSSDDFYELIPWENQCGVQYYSLFINKWGNPVVVKFHSGVENPTVAEIRCYSSLWISKTPQAFARIKENMTIYEVTSIVGIPLGTRTSGLCTSDYLDTKGQGYTILWHGSIYGDPPLFVRDVELFENKFYDEQGKFKYDEQGNLKTEPYYTQEGN